MDVDDPHALREIADDPAAGRRRLGGVLPQRRRPAARPTGSTPGTPPTGKGSRHGEGPAVRDARARRRPAAARRPRPTGPSSWRSDGSYALGQRVGVARAARRRARARRRRRPGRPQDAQVVVFPLPGRRRVLGVLVVHAPTARAARPGAVGAHRPGPDGPPRRPGHRQRAPLRPRAPAGRDAPARDAARAGRGRRARRVDVLRAELGERPGGRRLVRRAAGRARTWSASSSATSSGTTSRRPRRWASCARWSARTCSTSRRPARCSSASTSSSRACACRARRASSCRP